MPFSATKIVAFSKPQRVDPAVQSFGNKTAPFTTTEVSSVKSFSPMPR